MRTSSIYFTLFGTALSQELQARQSNWTVGQTVQTSSGPVNGHAASNGTEVSVYLGIPYAIPPVGELRWTVPQAYVGNSTINGTNYGFSCPANLAAFTSGSTSNSVANLTGPGIQILEILAQFGDNFSEDCLTANVWTKPQVGESKKAVLLWIYGGGFNTGNSDNPGYDGQFLADQEDVVVVTFNYRLNILGFPGSPNVAQNLGLLDQRLAIEWVRDNIEHFGGDASRITLFGQSAGGASVDYHTFAWTDDPIANAYIPQSGTVLSGADGLGHHTAEASAGFWYNVSSSLKCGDSTDNTETVLKCMRGKSWADVVSSIAKTNASFGPTADDQVVFSDYISRARAGNFTKRPILIGNTDYEAGLFKTTAAIAGTISPEIVWTQLNEGTFVCPGAARANVSISNGVTTWRYRWFGEFPNTRLTSVPNSGAWHASELPILFDTVPYPQDNTEEEIAIGKYLRGAWATFAKDPDNGLKSYGSGWPTYEIGGKTLIRLGYQNKTGTNLDVGDSYDSACEEIYPIATIVGGDGGGNSTANPTSVGSPSATRTSTTGATSPVESVSRSTKESVGYLLAIVLLIVAFLV